MADESKRERVIRMVREMTNNTVGRGCTPAEAARFAAKAAELIEEYQIGEAELRAERGSTPSDEMEVCENRLRTGKRAFNPGTTAVVSGLARGVCCETILLHVSGEAVYGIVGDRLDADYVCQIATSVVPALTIMARLDGGEHGHERGDLVKWCNQYLMGAGAEIQRRIEREREERSAAKRITTTSTALMVITGEVLAVEKKEATSEGFRRLYPYTRTVHSRTEFDPTAHERGRDAGRRVGLNVQIGGVQ